MTEHGTQPFEGSAEIAGIVAGLIKDWNVATFVETGTQHGATALWATQQGVRVITIESDYKTYQGACANLDKSGAEVVFGDSAIELDRLQLTHGANVLFFLDAHSAKWTRICSEIRVIGRLVTQFSIKPLLAIHDIEVPGHPELGFDHYEDGTVLDLGLIRDVLRDVGMADWSIQFNSTPDGAARGFCYITPK